MSEIELVVTRHQALFRYLWEIGLVEGATPQISVVTTDEQFDAHTDTEDVGETNEA